MGAGVETDDGHLPLGIEGAAAARSITYELPVASAQVKSAILLAGLYAERRDDRRRAGPDARPHRADARGGRGARSRGATTSVTVRPAERLELGEIEVPGDFSSAAPFIVAATLVPGSELHIHGVNLNPRRTGLLDDPRADGRPRHRLQPPPRSAASRPATSRCARPSSSRPRCSGRGGAARDRRAAAVRPRRLVRARRQPAARGGGAAREGDRSRRGDGRRASRARAARAARPRTASGSAASRPARAAAGSRAAATTGSRCSAPSPALASQEGVEIEDADCVAVSFPGFFELLDSLRREAAA